MFGLLALDIGNYTLPEDTAHNRAYMLDYLLSLSCTEVESGLMGLDGVGSVMFSIGPYQDDPVYGERVKQWLQNGAQYLADRVTSDYTLKSWGTTNSEVISWSLCGLCSAGIDPYTDPRFGTSEKNIITQWLDLFTTSDGYKHIAAETQSNQLATYEGCYALQWYLNFLEKGGNGTPYYLWYRQHDFSKKLSTDAKFLTFEIEGKQGVIQEAVNGGKNTITIELPKGTPLANVTPKFTLSEGATLKAPTLPVTLTADTEYPFTLRAEDGKTERVYYLTVTLKDDMKTSGTELYTDTIKLQDENQRDLEILKKTVTETETGADILFEHRRWQKCKEAAHLRGRILWCGRYAEAGRLCDDGSVELGELQGHSTGRQDQDVPHQGRSKADREHYRLYSGGRRKDLSGRDRR